MSGSPSTSSNLPPPIPAGTRIGRYVVLSQLGAGAMGIVLAAYDPELDRKAALKLLKRPSADRPTARMRLRREAQALAKLNHQNVLTVYDVGEHEGRLFLAMEFVEGQTLAQWMVTEHRRPRPWREIVAVFSAAGRGLAAVHEAGLVHRDFKPDNVMIGDDGRVCVADFGLARLSDSPEPELVVPVEDLPSPLQTKLTRVGASLGTPAYMAPEQLYGGEGTVSSDQYGFCVALFEALYGSLPYPGESVEALTVAVASGRMLEPPADAKVPAWLARVVLRGLSHKPQSRFADMPELLAALRSGASRRRRTISMIAIASVGLLVASGMGLVEQRAAHAEAECRARGDVIDHAWNDDTRAALRDGLLATNVGYAPTVIDKLMPWLDRYAQAWREQATHACMLAEVEGRWDTTTYDKASWCLEHHKVELEILVAELAVANAGAVEAAVSAAANLSRVEMCTDERSLPTLAAPPDVELQPEAAYLQRELMRAKVLEHAGEFETALEILRPALARAQALDYVPLTSAIRAAQAQLLALTGAANEAEVLGKQAYMEASISGAWDVAAAIASRQAMVVGVQQHRPDEAKIWAERDAVVALAHAGDPFGQREANRLRSLAQIHWNSGELEYSKRLHEQALQLQIAAFGPDHPNVAPTLISLGAVNTALGNYRETGELYERAIVLTEAMLGDEHPQLAACLNNLGFLLAQLDQHAAALPHYERALQIHQRSLGAEHPTTANTLANLGVSVAALGEPEEGEALLQQALATFERTLDPGHPLIWSARVNLAGVLIQLEQFDAAEVQLELAEAAGMDSDDEVACVLFGFAELYAARGELERAQVMHERALVLREGSLMPDNLEIADSLFRLGDVLERLGRRERARELYECALGIREAIEGSASDLAAVRLALARVDG